MHKHVLRFSFIYRHCHSLLALGTFASMERQIFNVRFMSPQLWSDCGRLWTLHVNIVMGKRFAATRFEFKWMFVRRSSFYIELLCSRIKIREWNRSTECVRNDGGLDSIFVLFVIRKSYSYVKRMLDFSKRVFFIGKRFSSDWRNCTCFMHSRKITIPIHTHYNHDGTSVCSVSVFLQRNLGDSSIPSVS